MAPVPTVLAFLNVGTQQLLFILLLVILLFGASKIPEFARALGKAQREFVKARDEVQTELQPSKSEEEQRVRRAAKELGLQTEGKTVRELKAEMDAKLRGEAGNGQPSS